MAINFSTGEFVVINRAYVETILAAVDCSCNKQTLASLGYIGLNPSEVLATGAVGGKAFLQARPSDRTNPAFKNNAGVVVYFCSDEHLNNSFELSTAYIDDKCFVKAKNISGGVLEKGSLVRQVGFDGTDQLPTINLADATTSANCAVLGICVSDVADTECASVLISGSFNGLDTSGFAAIGDLVYLSDTPGEISVIAGTEEKLVGRVMIVSATDGSISLVQSLGGSGGGGGGGFFTDGAGTNAAIGKGTVAPTAIGENALSQGDACIAGLNAFAQGDANSASSDESFAQGRSNSSASNSMAQGTSNSINGNDCFAQGNTNRLEYGYYSFAQGENNYLEGNTGSYVYQAFLQGKDNTTSYADNSLSQGLSNDINSGAHNSMAQGRDNIVGTPYSLAQGRDNTIPSVTGRANFVSGQNNTITGTFAYQSAIFGYGNDITNPYDTLVCGYEQDLVNPYGLLAGGWDNTLTSSSSYSIFWGNGLTAEGIAYCSIVGTYNDLNGSVFSSVVVGNAQVLDGNNSCISVGNTNQMGVGSDYGFIQGRDNFVSGQVRINHSGGITGTFSAGQTLTQAGSGATGVILPSTANSSLVTWVRKLTGTFAASGLVTTGTGSATTTSLSFDDPGHNGFAQGRGNIVSASQSMTQGYDNTMGVFAYNSAAFGRNNTVDSGWNSLTAGRNNTNSGPQSLVVGYGNTTSGDNSAAIGYNNTSETSCFTLGYDNTATGYIGVAIGRGSKADDGAGGGWNFAFGSNCEAGTGGDPHNVAFGGYYTYANGYNTFAHGYYSQNTGQYSAILGGFAATCEANNTFAQGKTAGADIVGQRAFSAQIASGGSSAGAFPLGPANAQWSFVAHEILIGGATASVDIDIPTDSGRAYSFQINMVANEIVGSPANRGSFVVSQMLAHNSAGTATIVGSPVFTTITDGTDIANFTTAITTSGANVRFTFTRNAATSPYRIAYYISFIEKD